MSVRIALEDPPEFYTNMDVIRGTVVISLSRQEPIGAIIVKLEGEAKTALGLPSNGGGAGGISQEGSPSGNMIHEDHKILYKVAQVFPDESAAALPQPVFLAPGQHEFPFQFKIPFNNMCSDPQLMASFAGIAGSFGGIRVMDGSKQLMYAHVTKTLPPSFTGFPGIAEIRYYLKATVQRPGLFNQNWRRQMGLKFLPLEPPRPAISHQESYARRPFTFQDKSSLNPTGSGTSWKRSALFAARRNSSAQTGDNGPSSSASGPTSGPSIPPSVEMSARLPHPSILTCNRSIPLRLIARKLVPSNADVFVVALQIDLIAVTRVRVQNLAYNEASRWVIVSHTGLSIPVSRAGDAVGDETVMPDALWRNVPLPNTIMPSFVTCNLSRAYELEVKLGLSWSPRDRNDSNAKHTSAQAIHLPLHFSSVSVYSGVAPPPQLVEAMRQGRRERRASRTTQQQQQQQPPQIQRRPVPGPPLPARQSQSQQTQAQRPLEPHDPLYPPQLAPGEAAPPYDEAPPSYDEAMAEEMPGPLFPAGAARPAYSGQTNENGPSTIPETDKT